MPHGSDVSLRFSFNECEVYSVTLAHPSRCSVLVPQQHDCSEAGTRSVFHYENHDEAECCRMDRVNVHQISSVPSYSVCGPSTGPDLEGFQSRQYLKNLI